MHEWTMEHPYLTFTLALFWIIMLNNIIMGLVRSPEKVELNAKTKKASESTDGDEY